MFETSSQIIVVAGTSSNAGKTTLVCELLARLPDWEAIKVTKGHYRSCGKQTDACCVGHLLGERALVYSMPEQTNVTGKDTGRFWQAGASNVHWVIARADQVEAGVKEAVSRVRSRGVVIESTSALAFLRPQVAILVASPVSPIKSSAMKALRDQAIDAIYLATSAPTSQKLAIPRSVGVPAFNPSSLPAMLTMIADRTDVTLLA
jgi:molybdopterin-guanine dinucleotide biosynthesis protein